MERSLAIDDNREVSSSGRLVEYRSKVRQINLTFDLIGLLIFLLFVVIFVSSALTSEDLGIGGLLLPMYMMVLEGIVFGIRVSLTIHMKNQYSSVSQDSPTPSSTILSLIFYFILPVSLAMVLMWTLSYGSVKIFQSMLVIFTPIFYSICLIPSGLTYSLIRNLLK